MSLFIDLHCHLDHCYFNNDLDKVIERARLAGLKYVITSGINPETNRMAIELCKKHDIVKCSLGIYPITALQKEIDSGEFPLKPNVFDIDEEIDFIIKYIPTMKEYAQKFKNEDKNSILKEIIKNYGQQ